MNKFVIGALATTMASGLSFAGSGTEEWAGLDRDIENLASSYAPQGSGFAVDGFLRSIYSNSSDISVGGNDLGGFAIANARVNVRGNVGDYGVFVSVDAAGGTAALLDAYGTFSIGDQVNGQMGQFRPPFLWSSQIDEDNIPF